MSRTHVKSVSSWGALLLCAAALYGAPALAGGLARQSSDAGTVNVSVIPKDVSPGAKFWLFDVALNTHSTDLADDLPRAASLVDAGGKLHPALAWEGDPAGGHHRRGVLRFEALTPRPDALELRLQRPGETTARTFRWNLK